MIPVIYCYHLNSYCLKETSSLFGIFSRQILSLYQRHQLLRHKFGQEHEQEQQFHRHWQQQVGHEQANQQQAP